MDPTIGASAWTYQSLSDGSNFTTAGVTVSIKPTENLKFGTYAGIGTSYKENSTGLVLDGSCSYSVSNNPDANISLGGRVRNKFTPSKTQTEVRPQINFSGKITNDVGWYTTAYARGTYDYRNDKNTTTHGIFAGVSYENLKAEVQLDSKNGVSLNFGVSF